MNKPNFHRLWLAFPDHSKYPSLKDLYTALGGASEKTSICRVLGLMETLVQAA